MPVVNQPLVSQTLVSQTLVTQPFNRGSIAVKVKAIVLSLLVTFSLLWVMVQLISSDLPVVSKISPPRLADITNEVTETTPEIIRPVILEPLTPPAPSPRNEAINNIKIDGVFANDNFYKPQLDGIGSNEIKLPSGTQIGFVSPVYPESMLRQNRCGDVLMQYDISSTGNVINVAVVSSSHSGFERSAIAAVSKYQYKPTLSGGKPVEIVGQQKRIVYKLDGGCQ